MKVFIIVILCVFASIAFAQKTTLEKQFESITVNELMSYNRWKFDNKRHYFNVEESSYRQILFFNNLKKIQKHNNKQNRSYEVGVNQFTDLTEEEFTAIALNPLLGAEQNHHGRILQDKQGNSTNTNTTKYPTFPSRQDPLFVVPQSVDWRIQGMVSPVKNQGGCGSCWAFVTTSLFESVNLFRTGVNVTFSEQELVDCTRNNTYRNLGCGGGYPHNAHQYIKDNGISLSSSYPYTGQNGSCRNTTVSKALYAKDPIFPYFNNPNRTNLVQYYVSKQPLTVLVDANGWRSYKSGVYFAKSNVINHAALLVGYTPEGNWIIKNSWGTSWGQEGYMILQGGNTCFVENQPMGSKI